MFSLRIYLCQSYFPKLNERKAKQRHLLENFYCFLCQKKKYTPLIIETYLSHDSRTKSDVNIKFIKIVGWLLRKYFRWAGTIFVSKRFFFYVVFFWVNAMPSMSLHLYLHDGNKGSTKQTQTSRSVYKLVHRS